jgi:ribosome-binding factor A
VPLVTLFGGRAPQMNMKATSNRNQRIAEQIQHDLAELIVREIRDPRVGLVTISGVEVSPDYAHAKVFFTVIGSPAQSAAEGLNAAARHLHHLLFKRLQMRTVPSLHFVHDTSVERGFEIDRLIDQAVGRRGSD